MRQMLDTRSSAASATQLSRLCKPSSKAVQKNCWQRRWGSVPESGAYRPVLMICFLSEQFSSKEKIHESLWTEIWKSTTLYWQDLVTVFRQKKAEHSVTDNVVWRAFLNTEQLLARRVTYHQQDREDHALLGEDSPMGEGGDLEQKDLWRISWHCRQSFMQKIS